MAVSWTVPALQETPRDVRLVVHSLGAPSFYLVIFCSVFQRAEAFCITLPQSWRVHPVRYCFTRTESQFCEGNFGSADKKSPATGRRSSKLMHKGVKTSSGRWRRVQVRFYRKQENCVVQMSIASPSLVRQPLHPSQQSAVGRRALSF